MAEGASGRRGNGLPAGDWGALVDLDPRLSAALLARLEAAGVAAYVEPATAVDTVLRGVTLPSRPLDRLWVDAARADAARTVVAAEVADLTALLAEDDPGAHAGGLVQAVPRGAARRVLPPPVLPGAAPEPAPGEPARPSDDEVFAQIVAGWDTPGDDPVPRWPVTEDDGPSAPPAPAPERRAPRRAEADLPGWVEPEALEPGEDDHFVPPPPPPAPRLRPRTLLAVLGIVVGVLLTFAPSLLGMPPTNGTRLLGMLALGGGAGALVWWLREPDLDDPDGGAVV